MGVRYDNFDLWNSEHTRWKAVNMGPHKDVVGMFHVAEASCSASGSGDPLQAWTPAPHF